MCSVDGCTHPRLRGDLCSYHRKISDRFPQELQVARAARESAEHMIPCDVTDFVTWIGESKDSATRVVLALIKEPSACKSFMEICEKKGPKP